MPHSLNPLTLFNKELIYDLFFRATSHALNVFAQDPKYLGGKLGFIGILHTLRLRSGQALGANLWQHIHLHYPAVCRIPGGGISNDGSRWVSLPYRKDFLFPVKAVSRRVRKKFAELLQKAYDKGELVFPDELAHLKNRSEFRRFPETVSSKVWRVTMKTHRGWRDNPASSNTGLNLPNRVTSRGESLIFFGGFAG